MHSPLGEPSRILTRNGPGLGEAAMASARIPAGHPEGYLEAFAQLYRDFAVQIRAHQKGVNANALAAPTPGVADGVDGLRFITCALASSAAGGQWMDV